jgi:CIC family chloride channel protein
VRKFLYYLKEYSVLSLTAVTASIVLAIFHYLALYIFDYVSLTIGTDWQNIVTIVAFDLSLIVINGFLIHLINRTGVNIFVIEQRIHNREWIRVGLNIALTFSTCYISFALGLALGMENPMTILGGLIGYFFYRLTGMHKRRGFLLGAAMGFSIALSNPFVGIAIYIEAYDKHASLKNILKVVYTSFLSYLVYSLIMGSFHSSMYFDNVQEYIDGIEATMLILIPFIAILFGYIYAKGIFLVKKLFQKHIPEYVDFILALTIAVCLKFFYPQVLGTGNSFFLDMEISEPIMVLIIYLVIRYGLILFSFNSNFNGGMVIPTLAFGAALGKLLVLVAANYLVFDQEQSIIIMLITMLCFYAFVTGDYFTSLFLSFTFINVQYIIVPLTFSLLLTYVLNAHTLRFSGISSILLKMDSINRYKVMPIFKVFDRPRYSENDAYLIKRSGKSKVKNVFKLFF